MNKLLIFSFTLLLSVNGEEAESCQCGRERLGTRIIGGTPVKPHRYPWMAGVLGGGFCGGSLINDRYVLTAAHCVSPSKLPRVVFGAHTLEQVKSGAGEAVSKVIIHPAYTGEVTSPGDIALVKLARPVTYSNSVAPICLAGSAQNSPTNLFVTGWGLTRPQSNQLGTQLNEVSLNPMNDNECKRAMGPSVNSKLQICAGVSGKSACNGDSGGPLSTRIDGRVYEIGVVSWGSGDCGVRSGNPTVYTRVPGYLDWIKANTKDAKYCN